MENRKRITIYDYPEHLNPFSDGYTSPFAPRYYKNKTWSSKLSKKLNRSVSWIEKSLFLPDGGNEKNSGCNADKRHPGEPNCSDKSLINSNGDCPSPLRGSTDVKPGSTDSGESKNHIRPVRRRKRRAPLPPTDDSISLAGDSASESVSQENESLDITGAVTCKNTGEELANRNVTINGHCVSKFENSDEAIDQNVVVTCKEFENKSKEKEAICNTTSELTSTEKLSREDLKTEEGDNNDDVSPADEQLTDNRRNLHSVGELEDTVVAVSESDNSQLNEIEKTNATGSEFDKEQPLSNSVADEPVEAKENTNETIDNDLRAMYHATKTECSPNKVGTAIDNISNKKKESAIIDQKNENVNNHLTNGVDNCRVANEESNEKKLDNNNNRAIQNNKLESETRGDTTMLTSNNNNGNDNHDNNDSNNNSIPISVK